jgi:ubiquinone/menaquinone biosynthesis C-methylase UbiE
MNPFRRHNDPHALVVGMTGAKLGDRLAQIGCVDGARMAAIAAKVGVSGRAQTIVSDQTAAERARKGAALAGVPVQIDVAPLTKMPAADAAFDLVVVDDTAGLFASVPPQRRLSVVGEIFRILCPGGRVVVIGPQARGGMIGAIFSRLESPTFHVARSLTREGFGSVRTLAERDELTFVAAIKPIPER